MEEASIQVETIVIDARKAEYIRRVHNVQAADVDEVRANVPRFFRFDAIRGIYDMIGPSRSGRFLVVGIQNVAGAEWRLITAYWSTDGRAAKLYEEARRYD